MIYVKDKGGKRVKLFQYNHNEGDEMENCFWGCWYWCGWIDENGDDDGVKDLKIKMNQK